MLSADSAAIALSETPDSGRFATESAERVEVSEGRHSHAGKGALVGLGVGAGTGLILGLAASAEECGEWCVIEVGRRLTPRREALLPSSKSRGRRR